MLSDRDVTGDADLSGADLGTLSCLGSTFGGKASLRRTALLSGGTFPQARFGRADFDQVRSTHKVVLDEAYIEESLRLTGVALPLLSLRRTRLSGTAVANGQVHLPPGRRIDGDDRKGWYLVAPEVSRSP